MAVALRRLDGLDADAVNHSDNYGAGRVHTEGVGNFFGDGTLEHPPRVEAELRHILDIFERQVFGDEFRVVAALVASALSRRLA